MASAAQQVMLAHKWDEKMDPTGYWMSEKLDGVRAYWSGSKFYSRQGNEFIAPKWFTKDLPKEPLDGELWCGRGLFQKTLSIVRKTKDPEKHADDWRYVTYLIFDAPARSDAGMKYEQRVKWLEDNIDPKRESTYATVVGVCKCTGLAHLQAQLKQVLLKGGEGIMLRAPGSRYEKGRSHCLLKCKYFHSEEAKVTGHENGSGRCQNMMGKIHCVLPNGVTFKVGSGFTDAQRRSPPKIGSIIEFKFQELSEHGNPRFPTFLRERPDLTWADVLQNAKTKAPFSSLKRRAAPLLQKQHSILFSTVPSRDEVSGRKVVTSNDCDDDAEAEADNLLTRRTAGLASPSSPTAASAPAAAAASSSSPAASPSRKRDATGKRMCQWGAACYQRNQKHLDAFDHPPRDGDGKDEAKDEEEPSRKKVKKDDGSAAPAASSSSAAVAASAPSRPRSPVPCRFAESCYNRDPAHLARFSHPPPKKPETVEEFIETTNQSQVDLADYYKFGADEEEEEVAELLAEDRNERRLSIQRFNENLPPEKRMELELQEEEIDAEGEVRTVILTAAPKRAGSFFQACASDDEDEVAARGAPLALAQAQAADARSDAQTEVVAAAAASAGRRSSARSRTAASSAVAPLPPSSSAATSTPAAASCPFLIPELLAKDALTVESDAGEICCKRCKKEVGDHRESRA